MSRSIQRSKCARSCGLCALFKLLGHRPTVALADHLREADDEADVCCLLGDCYACWDDAEGMVGGFCEGSGPCPGCDDCVIAEEAPDVSGWRPKMAVVA